MTPHEKREAAAAMGELHVAYLAIDAALSRLNAPLSRSFVPEVALRELTEARQLVSASMQGLHMLTAR